MVTALKMAGYRVDLLLAAPMRLEAGGPLRRFRNEAGIRMIFPGSWPMGAGRAGQLIRAICVARRLAQRYEYHATVAYNMNPDSVLPAFAASGIADGRTLLQLEEDVRRDHEAPWVQRGFARVVQPFSRFDAVLAVSPSLLSDVRFNRSEVQPGVIAPTILEQTRLIDLPIARLKDNERIRVHFMARFDETRGARQLVEVVQHCDQLTTPADFHVTGYGTEAEIERFRGEVLRASRKLRSCSIQWHGTVERRSLERLLSEAHIALNLMVDPDFGAHSFPSKLVELLASGTVVVSHPAAAVVKAVPRGVVQFTEDFSAAAVAQAIHELSSRGAFLSVAAAAGRVWAERTCSLEALSKRLSALLA